MVDFARRDTELDRHESLLHERHRADAHGTDGDVRQPKQSLEAMQQALAQMRLQMQQLQRMQTETGRFAAERSQLLSEAGELLEMERRADEQTHGLNFTLANRMHTTATCMENLLAQSA